VSFKLGTKCRKETRLKKKKAAAWKLEKEHDPGSTRIKKKNVKGGTFGEMRGCDACTRCVLCALMS